MMSILELVVICAHTMRNTTLRSAFRPLDSFVPRKLLELSTCWLRSKLKTSIDWLHHTKQSLKKEGVVLKAAHFSLM